MIKYWHEKIHIEVLNFLTLPDITLLLLLLIYVISGITLVPFHGDESTYIWTSRDYDQIVKQRDLKGILFNPIENMNDPDQWQRLSIGSILTFSIGFTRDLVNSNDDLNNQWNWDYSPKENIQKGNYPSPLNLIIGRICSASMGALSLIFLFLTTYRLFQSRLSAWITVLLFATHGDILINIRRAMQEGPKFLFLFITLYISSLILKNLTDGKSDRFLYGMMGLFSGLTLAAKQDTAPVLAAIYIALAMIPIYKKSTTQTILINVLYLGSATIIAVASFLIFMPVFWYWWDAALSLYGLVILLFQIPVLKTKKTARVLAIAGCAFVIVMTMISPDQWGRLHVPFKDMIKVRELIVGSQLKHRIKTNLGYLDTAKQKAKFLVLTTLRSKPMYMELSSFNVNPIEKEIKTYEASLIHGRIRSPMLDVLIAILFIIGGWNLLRYFDAEALLAITLFIVTAVVLFMSVPLPWQRYFLIMQIPYLLIAGVGAGRTWAWGRQLIKQ
jgi:hypothetical protein